MKIHFLLLILIYSTISLAQVHKGYNRVHGSFAWQNFRDQRSVKYDNIPPSGHVDPHDPNGYYWGIQFERTTRHGVLLGMAFRNGIRRYDLNVTQNISDFDPLAIQTLKGQLISTGTYQLKRAFNSGMLHVGYKWQWHSKWTLSGRAGLAVKVFQESALSDEVVANHITYKTDNGANRALINATMVTMQYGRRDSTKKKFGRKGAMPYYEVYLGIDRQFDMIAFKSLSIGIEAARSFQGWEREPAVIVLSSPTIDKPRASRDVFIDRNISIGIRLSVGVWK